MLHTFRVDHVALLETIFKLPADYRNFPTQILVQWTQIFPDEFCDALREILVDIEATEPQYGASPELEAVLTRISQLCALFMAPEVGEMGYR